uniref:Uncharacterized protein n=1 Tax=Sphaerodactylus townsendi TaxID=933632 RepID=A0ACB8FB75_9SAUR
MLTTSTAAATNGSDADPHQRPITSLHFTLSESRCQSSSAVAEGGHFNTDPRQQQDDSSPNSTSLKHQRQSSSLLPGPSTKLTGRPSSLMDETLHLLLLTCGPVPNSFSPTPGPFRANMLDTRSDVPNITCHETFLLLTSDNHGESMTLTEGVDSSSDKGIEVPLKPPHLLMHPERSYQGFDYPWSTPEPPSSFWPPLAKYDQIQPEDCDLLFKHLALKYAL